MKVKFYLAYDSRLNPSQTNGGNRESHHQTLEVLAR